MSWQDYVDKQLLASKCVTKAAIAGHDGNLWAKSEGFEVSNAIPLQLSTLARPAPPSISLSLLSSGRRGKSFSPRMLKTEQGAGGRGTR